MTPCVPYSKFSLSPNLVIDRSEPISARRFMGNIFRGVGRWLSGGSSTGAAQGDESDVRRQGFQVVVATPIAASGSAGDERSTIYKTEPQPEKEEGFEEAKSFGVFRKEGKAGDHSSEVGVLRECPESPGGSRKEGNAGEKSSKGVHPKDAQERPADEEVAGKPELDKESNTLEDGNGTILAERLGTQAATFFDSSFGVALILEDGSLEKEIKKQVVVKQEIRYITCSSKRDTSRTHEELRVRASDDGVGELTFLAMPIVHGPSEAIFHPDRPARLRYFAGYSEDIQQEIKDKGRDDHSNDAIELYLRKMYEPLISANGIHWRMLSPFEVHFAPSPDDGEQVWLETQLYHFSEGAIGKLIPKLSKASLPKSEYAGNSIFKSGIPLLKRLVNRGHVIFGNATEEELIFYACKKEDAVSFGQRKMLGVGIGGTTITGETEQNVSSVSHGIDHIIPYVVEGGRYRLVEMPKDGNWVHRQILCAVFKPEKRPGNPADQRSQFFLLKEPLSVGKVFATLPKSLSGWLSREGPNTTKKLDYDAPLLEVRKFLLDH